MKRLVVLLVFAIIMVNGWRISRVQAQSKAPQVYSYTLTGASMVIKASRDGAKEVVDQIFPKGEGRDQEYHGRILYDFQAHKIYTHVLSDPAVPCSVMEYTSAEVPSLFDPISSATELNQQLASDHPPGKLGNPETVNGIATKTVEASSPDGKTKMWIAERGGYLFPVKVVLIGSDGKEQSYLEMKQLSFAKPAASAFTAPSGCTKVQGESSATGGHAEFGTGDSSPKLSTNVTAVTLQEVPNFNGACPAHIKMVGTITADGPGKVFYRFGAGTYEKGQTIAFSAAGTKTVSQVMNFNPEFGGGMGVSAILEAVGVDAKGQPGMMTKGSNNADFSITCASAGVKSTGASTKSPDNTVAQGEKTNAQVTDVQLKVTPANYSGPCPVKVKLVGTLTADGPGKGYYEFQAGAVGANREGAVDLKAAGNETVASEGMVRSTPQVPTVRFLAGMEPRGSQENAKWADVDLNITCTPAK